MWRRRPHGGKSGHFNIRGTGLTTGASTKPTLTKFVSLLFGVNPASVGTRGCTLHTFLASLPFNGVPIQPPSSKRPAPAPADVS